MKSTSNNICNFDQSVCISKGDFLEMNIKANNKSSRNNRKEFIYLSVIYQKWFIGVLIALLFTLGLFTYGGNIETIARFMGFSLICYLTIYVVFITAPVFVFFAMPYYHWLLDFAGLGATTLTILIFTISLAIGILGFIVLVFSLGGLRGYFFGKHGI